MPLLHLEPLPPRATKGDIIHLLCAVGGISGEQIGRIELYGAIAAVEVPSGWEMRLARAMDGTEFRGRELRVRAGGVAQTGPNDHFGHLACLVRLESDEEAR